MVKIASVDEAVRLLSQTSDPQEECWKPSHELVASVNENDGEFQVIFPDDDNYMQHLIEKGFLIREEKKAQVRLVCLDGKFNSTLLQEKDPFTREQLFRKIVGETNALNFNRFVRYVDADQRLHFFLKTGGDIDDFDNFYLYLELQY